MRETRYKAQADSKDSALSLLEARVTESEKARKDHEEKMKLKIEVLEQVHKTCQIYSLKFLIIFCSVSKPSMDASLIFYHA